MTITKYGRHVTLAKRSGTKIEQEVVAVLDELGVRYEPQFFFDVKGYRTRKFDFAVFREGEDEPCLLIERDGAPHYDPEFYKSMGVRPSRAEFHVTRCLIGDARKLMTAVHFGVSLVRIPDEQASVLRDLLLAYITVIVERSDNKRDNEKTMVAMYEHHGWGDHEYVMRSDDYERKYGKLPEFK